MTPGLKQFGDLTREDFERHPVWVGCQTVDYDEPWYDDTDEETFRPWNGVLPADAAEGMLLVGAVLELRDGTKCAGFVTPSVGEPDLGVQQPQIFAGGRRFAFWGGVAGTPESERHELYAALGKTPEQVFPVRFRADSGLTTGVADGEIPGCCRYRQKEIQVEF